MDKISFNKWFHEDNYAGEEYEEYYIIYSKTRDSESVEKSNFDTIIKLFDENNIHYINPSFSHWLSGCVEVIMIHEKHIKDLMFAQEEIYNKLEQYPLLDEDLYSKYEYEENTYYCDKCKKDTYHIESVCDICQEG
jgi:hypothetical protein